MLRLEGISLQYFRNQSATFHFPHSQTVVVGVIGAGNTALLAAIALLSTGESFRAEEVSEMVGFAQELSRVKANILRNEEKVELEIVLTRGIVNGKRVQHRLYSVNGVRRRKQDFVAKLLTVVFRPEDMRLVEGSPARRRQFIDTMLSLAHREYAEALKGYEEGLKKRNRLLDQVKEGAMPATVLKFWTELILAKGTVLQNYRQAAFQEFPATAFPLTFRVKYEPSLITTDRLAQYREKEIMLGYTLIGPHKDDFIIEFPVQNEMVDVAKFGSRGQQRFGVLWLKVCERAYIEQKTGQSPVLLLDDILSELDEEHRHEVWTLLKTGQSILTTTEPSLADELKQKYDRVQVINLP